MCKTLIPIALALALALAASAAFAQSPVETDGDKYKVVMENVRHNATMVAMLTYLASEDPQTVSRDRRQLGVNRRTLQRKMKRYGLY